MIFNKFLPTVLLSTLLFVSAAGAKIEINERCIDNDGSDTPYNFSLTASKINAKAGSIDIDETVELSKWYSKCRLSKNDSTVEQGPYTAAIAFNTSKDEAKVNMTVDFMRDDVAGWNATFVSVAFIESDEFYAKKALSSEKLKELGWHSATKKGYKCAETHIQFGKQNSVDIDNLQFVPFLKDEESVPADDDQDYKECKVDPPPQPSPPMPWWGIVLTVIGAVVLVGVLGYCGYRLYQKRT